MRGKHRRGRQHGESVNPRLLRLLLPVVFVAVFAVAALAAEAPQRHVGLRDAYTEHQGCRLGHVDPINTVWSGKNALPSKVARGLERHGHWTDDDYRSPFGVDYQAVSEVSGCFRDEAERADGCIICDRNHVRLFPTARGSARYVVGDAHHDHNVASFKCGAFPIRHISSSFNAPRDAIMHFWPGRKHYDNWGNTARLKQCNGSYTRSDGHVGVMRG